MQIAKLYTKDEIRDLISIALCRIGDDNKDDAKFGMVVAMMGTRIIVEIDQIIEEEMEKARNGKKKA